MAASELIVIGEVVRPHGVRGEVGIALHADSPLIFDDVRDIHLRGPLGRMSRHTVKGWRQGSDKVLLRLAGVEDRDAAELLRGHEILVRASELPEPDEDEVYLHELEGADVFLESGERLGTIEHFLDTGGGEVWAIRTDDGREVLFPAEDEFVAEIDSDNRRVVIAPPPGLLEIYLGEGQAAG